MIEWAENNTALVGVIAIFISVGIPGLVALWVAKRYQPSAEAQELKLKAETDKIIAEVNTEVQEQLRDALGDAMALIKTLEGRVDALEKSLAVEKVERARLEDELSIECGLRKDLEVRLVASEARLEQVHAWAKALEAQVIELGATPVPFSQFAS